MDRYLIIAGSSGIGQAVSKQLRNSGHEVITTARNHQKIKANYVLDAADFDAVDHVFQSVGDIDGVVNCSGSLLLKPAHLTTQAQFATTIQSSLTTAFATVRSAGQYMTKGGAVVLISSAAARIGMPNHEAIAAAKSGIHGLVLSASATYSLQNLRINAIAPGLVETTLTANIIANENARHFSQSLHALKRFGQPEDIARMVCFLLAPENNWITGQIIGVDGGLGSVHARIS